MSNLINSTTTPPGHVHLDWEKVINPENQSQEGGGHSQQAKSAQTYTQQEVELGTGSPIEYIYNSCPSCPQIESQGYGGSGGSGSSGDSATEKLLAILRDCENMESFAAAVGGVPEATIEAAISGQDTAPRRQQMTRWWDSLRSGAIAPQEVSRDVVAVRPLKVGDRVKVKDALLDGRHSFMRGLEGVVDYVSLLGRIVIESDLGRREPFDECEVLLLAREMVTG